MSYRLISANGITFNSDGFITAKNIEKMPCIYADLPNGMDGEHYVLEQEPKTGWNNHQIACMLADLFGDTCACNYNGIDEWLGKLCDFKDTCCPNPVGVACWEQFLKHSQSRYTECVYEIRNKESVLDKISTEKVRDKQNGKDVCPPIRCS